MIFKLQNNNVRPRLGPLEPSSEPQARHPILTEKACYEKRALSHPNRPSPGGGDKLDTWMLGWAFSPLCLPQDGGPCAAFSKSLA